MSQIDVLIPTYNRPTALAVTLASLCAQTFRQFRIVVSDQSDSLNVADLPEIRAIARILAAHRTPVVFYKHLPRQGITEQRYFLLTRASAPYVLFLDDDVQLEPWVVTALYHALQQDPCGFVGNAPIGLSFVTDVRPQEQAGLEFWTGPVLPEVVRPGTSAWDRWQLHNAANLYHIQQRLGTTPAAARRYKVAWVAGCVLFDRAKLQDVGGFSFWSNLPATACGEDVLVQQRLMARYGGCGLLPSGAYHQELPTTLPDRSQDAPHLLPLQPPVEV